MTSTKNGFAPAHVAHVQCALAVARRHRPDERGDLADWLHARWYAIGGTDGSGPTLTANGGRWMGTALPGTLTGSHADTDRWQDGAIVLSTARDGAVVVRTGDGRVRALGRGDYQCPDGMQGLEPTPGAVLRIRRRQGCVVTDGWWRTWDGDRDDHPIGAISRISLAANRDEVCQMVGVITGHLRGVGYAWTLEVGTDPQLLARPDGAVVYVPDGALLACLGRLIPAVAGLLRPYVPPLMRQVAPGIAWSHDPGDGQRFGEHRCRIIAAACEDTGRTNATGADVEAAFRRAGLDPAAPHLRSPVA